MRTILLAGLALALSGCASFKAPPAPPQCLPLAPYTEAEQIQLASELAPLPDGSMIARAMVDYGRLRDADRACQSASAKP